VQGPEGPAGITQLTNDTNVYLVQDVQSGSGSGFSGVAKCDQGDFVLNGGYSMSGFTDDNTLVSSNEPLTFPIPILSANPGEAWRASCQEFLQVLLIHLL
jgi:hypothetical protein